MVLSGTWTDRACLTACAFYSRTDLNCETWIDLLFIFTSFCLESPGSRVLALRCAKALDSAAKLGTAVSQDWGESWQNSTRADNMIYAAKLAR